VGLGGGRGRNLYISLGVNWLLPLTEATLRANASRVPLAGVLGWFLSSVLWTMAAHPMFYISSSSVSSSWPLFSPSPEQPVVSQSREAVKERTEWLNKAMVLPANMGNQGNQGQQGRVARTLCHRLGFASTRVASRQSTLHRTCNVDKDRQRWRSQGTEEGLTLR